MKSKLICLFCLLFVFTIVSVPSCFADKSEVRTNVVINVYGNLTFDYHMSKDFGSLGWGTKSWTLGFTSTMKNIRIYDSYGNAVITGTRNIGEFWTDYDFDLNHAGVLREPIYADASGELLVNGSLNQLQSGESIYNTNITYDNVTLQINFPDSMTLFGQCDYNARKFCSYSKNATISYINPSTYNDFFLFNGTDFIEIKDGSKTYLVENNSVLTGMVNSGLQHKDLILGFPNDKEDSILVSWGNKIQMEGESGMYMPNLNTILIKSGLSDNQIYLSVFLHELTHYANHADSQQHNFPVWLGEGSAVYTQIKLVDINSPLSNSLKPLPSLNMVENWYNLSSDNYISDLNGQYRYSIGAFIVDYYAKTYGDNALLLSFRDINRKTELETNFGAMSINDSEVEKISEDSLIIFSGANITKTDLFFPQKELFFQNRTEFEKNIINFTSDYRNYNYGNINISMFYFAGIVIGIILILAVPVGIIVKFFRKKKKK